MEQMVDTFQPDQSDDFQDFLLVVKGVLIKGKGRLPEKNALYIIHLLAPLSERCSSGAVVQ